MDDTLAAAIAQQEARKVAKAAVDETVHSQVGAQLPPVVDEKLPFLVASAVPGLVEAAYLANPPKDGKDGADAKAAIDGTNGKDGTNGTDGVDGQDGLSINWRGPWTKGTYLPLDAVELDGSSYIASSITRTKPPGKGWDLMAKKGQDGGVKGGYNVRGFASGMVVDDEGTRLNSGAVIGEINFVGSGVTASMSGGKALVTIPGGGGGGSISVTDGTTTVNPATTLTLPAGSVTDLGGGDAGVTFPGIDYVQDADPGAVGARKTWVQTTPTFQANYQQWVRNAANDGWIKVGIGNITSTDDSAEFNSYYVSGNVAATVGVGVADGSSYLEALTDSPHVQVAYLGLNVNQILIRRVNSLGATTTEVDQRDAYYKLTAPLLKLLIAGSAGPGPLVSDGTNVGYSIAAFVNPATATPEAIATALIAAGLMAPV